MDSPFFKFLYFRERFLRSRMSCFSSFFNLTDLLMFLYAIPFETMAKSFNPRSMPIPYSISIFGCWDISFFFDTNPTQSWNLKSMSFALTVLWIISNKIHFHIRFTFLFKLRERTLMFKIFSLFYLFLSSSLSPKIYIKVCMFSH